MGQLAPQQKQALRHVVFHETTQSQIFASLHEGVDPKRFAAQCLSAIQEVIDGLPQSVDPSRVTPSMFIRASQRTAAAGLTPGKDSSEVAWIFRKGWSNKPDSLDIMPQWQSQLRKMRMDPEVADIEVMLVHDSDTFRYSDGIVEHQFDPFGDREFTHPDNLAEGQKSGLRGGYLRISYKDGRTKFHMMGAVAIHKRRMCSTNPSWIKAYKQGDEPKPSGWILWFEEFCKKTVVRDGWARRVVNPPMHVVVQLQRISALIDESDENSPERGGAALVSNKAVRPSERITAPKGQDVLKMALEQVDAPPVEPEPVAVMLEGDALRDAQKKLRAMAGECAKQPRSNGDAKAYFEAVKAAVGVESSKMITADQAQTMEQYLRDDIEGREPLL